MFHWDYRSFLLLFTVVSLWLRHATAMAATVAYQSQCACGNVCLEIPAASPTATSVVDCHCPHCRKYHVAGWVRYLVVPKQQDLSFSSDDIKTYRDECDQLGVVDRIQCRHCTSKLLTRPVHGDDEIMLVNMGPLVDNDDSLAQLLTQQQQQPEQWQIHSKAAWVDAIPNTTNDDVDDTSKSSRPTSKRTIAGGCSCGNSRYEFDCEQQPTELQHCYCRLCRQLSGGPFMTWMPVWKEDFRWINTESTPPLVRTTPHGQRHICADCGAALTIVYDDQLDLIWPAAGGFDDAAALQDDLRLSRVVHICCRYRPTWYTIPSDGLPRIPEAG